MSNIGYFEIPAEDVDRAKKFYHALLGWKIVPTKTPMDPAMKQSMEYQDVITGNEEKGTMSWGGMYKRQMSENIINYVLVDNIDKVLANVEKLGGKIEVPKREIKTIGEIAIIRDTEGNAIGIWKSAMK
ncbi:MAG: VOC family protein [Methanoregula sp.]|uniref:VOC family protein n=1 Tax=Methanoregula sp. TaxID=2052170 RepID=UPI003BAF42A1